LGWIRSEKGPIKGEAGALAPAEPGSRMELPPITSSQNRQIGEVRRLLARPRECRREGVLVADGIHLVQEALRANLRCRALFVTVAERDREIANILAEAEKRRLPVYRVLDHLFRVISPVETPQGVVGIFNRPARAPIWKKDGKAEGHLIVTHGLQDPTNIGAILRSGLAAGMSGLITTPGTVDPFHHRALRASMGAAFHLPIRVDEPAIPLVDRLGRLGYRTVALSPRAEMELTELNPLSPIALILGAEGTGLNPSIEAAASLRVRIPMQDGVESLGVAAAGAVAFFWLRLASRNGRAPHP
jgi:TrmH family RNA methyltransferase